MKLIDFIKEPFEGKKISSIIFFVTYKCNSKCKHCFYWKNINKKEKELSLNEIEKISNNLPRFSSLSLSGGEPFLRNDLVEICEIFYKKNKINYINIPTNCLLTNKIYDLTKKILLKCPKIKLTINISLDGLEKTHDTIRGVKGNFKKVEETIKKLNELKEDHKNLIINVSTVITNKNLSELNKLIDYVKKNMIVDNHSFEVMRGNPKDKEYKPISVEQFKKIKRLSLKVNFYYSAKRDQIKEWYKKRKLDLFYDQQLRALRNQPWQVPCLAGINFLVIEPNGEVRPCELLKSIGNLKDFNYDIKKLLRSKKARTMIKCIKKNRCRCTHCIAIYESLVHSPKISFLPFIR